MGVGVWVCVERERERDEEREYQSEAKKKKSLYKQSKDSWTCPVSLPWEKDNLSTEKQWEST